VDALKHALQSAKSIVYADPAKGGLSGVYFARVLDRLGLADQLKAKTILVPGAQAAEVVARGEAELWQIAGAKMPPGLRLAQTVSRPRLLRCLGTGTINRRGHRCKESGEAASAAG
jgi:hypothetical protein